MHGGATSCSCSNRKSLIGRPWVEFCIWDLTGCRFLNIPAKIPVASDKKNLFGIISAMYVLARSSLCSAGLLTNSGGSGKDALMLGPAGSQGWTKDVRLSPESLSLIDGTLQQNVVPCLLLETPC